MFVNQATYDLLPYAYISAGLLNGMLMDTDLRFMPTLLLVSAGFLVMAWRRSARLRMQKAVNSRLPHGSHISDL